MNDLRADLDDYLGRHARGHLNTQVALELVLDAAARRERAVRVGIVRKLVCDGLLPVDETGQPSITTVQRYFRMGRKAA